MASTVAVVRFWHFECPECGFGDEEMGALAEAHDIICEICFAEDRHVRLRRWAADHADPDHSAAFAEAAEVCSGACGQSRHAA